MTINTVNYRYTIMLMIQRIKFNHNLINEAHLNSRHKSNNSFLQNTRDAIPKTCQPPQNFPQGQTIANQNVNGQQSGWYTKESFIFQNYFPFPCLVCNCGILQYLFWLLHAFNLWRYTLLESSKDDCPTLFNLKQSPCGKTEQLNFSS